MVNKPMGLAIIRIISAEIKSKNGLMNWLYKEKYFSKFKRLSSYKQLRKLSQLGARYWLLGTWFWLLDTGY
jgi:hypothetical protein